MKKKADSSLWKFELPSIEIIYYNIRQKPSEIIWPARLRVKNLSELCDRTVTQLTSSFNPSALCRL